MKGQIGEWLLGEFVVLGIHFQNWMLIAAIIALLGILYVIAPPENSD